MIDFTVGAVRRRIEIDDAVKLEKAGTLIRDNRRRRPYYFDGRFLTARDLTREQNYFLARQAELGRATGSGVVTGLGVTLAPPSTVRIDPGHGITATGELMTLTAPLRIDLADVSLSQDLDVRFGVSTVPQPAARNRSGVFILAMRPVEFTANPIASYPQSLTGPRTVQDGEIVEAVAITLIPYADESAPSDIAKQQSRVARDLFLKQGALLPSANALPLAMVSLSRGTVNWLDVFLVRREVGADHGDTLGLGFAPRAIREAHFLQYRDQLSSILARRRQLAQSPRFSASEYFYALPPVGPLPAAAVDTTGFSQVYFPQKMNVELSPIPEDELRALIEDALLLPPIDLTLRDQEQESTSILILAPVPRREFQLVEAGVQLKNQIQPGALPVPKLLAGRTPLEVLSALTLRNQALPLEQRQIVADDRWRNAITRIQSREDGTGTPMLWYVRRRNLAYKPDLAGPPLQPTGDDFRKETFFLQMLTGTGQPLAARWTALRSGKATVAALAAALDGLAQPKLLGKTIAIITAMVMFEQNPQLTEGAARQIAVRIGDAKFGDGVQRFTGTTLAANPIALGQLLGANPSIVEFDMLLQTSDAAKIVIAVNKLQPLLANPVNFQKQISDWVTAKVIS